MDPIIKAILVVPFANKSIIVARNTKLCGKIGLRIIFSRINLFFKSRGDYGTKHF